MPLLPAALIGTLKGLLSKALIFAQTQDAKWWKGLLTGGASNLQALNAATLLEVRREYGLPPMDLVKAARILQTAPYEINRAKEKAAAGESPQVQARYAAAFAVVLDEAIKFTSDNLPADQPAKGIPLNVKYAIAGLLAAFFILPKLLKN